MDPEEANFLWLDQQRIRLELPPENPKQTDSLPLNQFAMESPHCQQVNHGKSSAEDEIYRPFFMAILHSTIFFNVLKGWMDVRLLHRDVTPGIFNVPMNLALFSGITLLACTAKRQLERHERYSMLQLINERPRTMPDYDPNIGRTMRFKPPNCPLKFGAPVFNYGEIHPLSSIELEDGRA